MVIKLFYKCSYSLSEAIKIKEGIDILRTKTCSGTKSIYIFARVSLKMNLHFWFVRPPDPLFSSKSIISPEILNSWNTHFCSRNSERGCLYRIMVILILHYTNFSLHVVSLWNMSRLRKKKCIFSPSSARYAIDLIKRSIRVTLLEIEINNYVGKQITVPADLILTQNILFSKWNIVFCV